MSVKRAAIDPIAEAPHHTIEYGRDGMVARLKSAWVRRAADFREVKFAKSKRPAKFGLLAVDEPFPHDHTYRKVSHYRHLFATFDNKRTPIDYVFPIDTIYLMNFKNMSPFVSMLLRLAFVIEAVSAAHSR